jgi:hypothetical protein
MWSAIIGVEKADQNVSRVFLRDMQLITNARYQARRGAY